MDLELSFVLYHLLKKMFFLRYHEFFFFNLYHLLLLSIYDLFKIKLTSLN